MSAKILVATIRRMWTWCCNHRLVSVLLVVIALQQIVIARAYYSHREREVLDNARTLLVELLHKKQEILASRVK